MEQLWTQLLPHIHKVNQVITKNLHELQQQLVVLPLLCEHETNAYLCLTGLLPNPSYSTSNFRSMQGALNKILG
jgi:hypothetical protein